MNSLVSAPCLVFVSKRGVVLNQIGMVRRIGHRVLSNVEEQTAHSAAMQKDALDERLHLPALVPPRLVWVVALVRVCFRLPVRRRVSPSHVLRVVRM